MDLDIQALQAKGLSPNDVVNAVGTQNLILPAGTVKIGTLENDVDLNGSPKTVEELNDLPIKTVGTNTIYVRDVAHVRDGYPPQTNIVHVDGQRAALMTVLKSGNASTLDIIARIKEATAQGACDPAAGTASSPHRGPIRICPRRHQRGGPGSDHRRVPDRV